MKTEAFDYCLKIFDHWNDPESEIRSEILLGQGNFIKRFVDPFRRELGLNLLTTITLQEKIALFKFYIHELNRTTNIIEYYEKLGISDVPDEDFELILNTLYFVTSDIETSIFFLIHYLYVLLFTEIQLLCKNDNIPFLEICKELDFPLNSININLTSENEKWMKYFLAKDAKPPQKSPETQTPPDIKPTIEPDFKKTLSEIGKLENQFWKGLPMERVIEHFKIMTTNQSDNGNVYLTTEQLISFLRKGFLNDTNQPKQKINCTRGEKGFVIKRFYDLFDLACREYYFPEKKGKFINLFIDCFDNWEPKTIEPFFRPNRAKGKW